MSKNGELTATAMTHVARMMNGHNLDLKSGGPSGNTTPSNRSTAIGGGGGGTAIYGLYRYVPL